MQRLTPLVQPLSIDEAVLDLRGTEALHGAPPAAVLARFARCVEREVGITVSIGLAANRLLAKIAAGRDKPRGFCVLGAEAASVLAPEPVRLLPGVGPALARRLEAMGITRLAHLQALDDRAARARLGEDGPALVRRARGEDSRPIDPARETKSISAETTSSRHRPRRAGTRVVAHDGEARASPARTGFPAGGVVLKLKTADFHLRTRAHRLAAPTGLPDLLFAAARPLLQPRPTARRFASSASAPSPCCPARSPTSLTSPIRWRRGGWPRRPPSTRCAGGSGRRRWCGGGRSCKPVGRTMRWR